MTRVIVKLSSGHPKVELTVVLFSDTMNTYWNKINPQDITNFLSLLE